MLGFMPLFRCIYLGGGGDGRWWASCLFLDVFIFWWEGGGLNASF